MKEWLIEMKMTRRTFIKSFFWAVAGGFLMSSGLYNYARYIEPRRLEVKKKAFFHPKLSQALDGLKLVQFSDTHLNDHFQIEHLKKVVNKVNEFEPDLIVFTGDLIDEPNRYPYLEQIPPVLKRLRASLGKFAVYGNHDHGGYGTDLYEEILLQADFHLLKNERKEIELLDGSRIVLAGLDDYILGKPDFGKIFRESDKNDFTILLVHEPDAVLQAKEYHFDLQLSGHSHGGQVKIPFCGAVYTPPYAKRFTEGFYKIGQTSLYVNRGLGTTRLPFRFLSVPEITLFTLHANK